MDEILIKDDYVVVLELKYDENKSLDSLLDDAIDQIIDNDYYKSYQDKKIILVGVAFKHNEIKSKLLKI